MKQVLFRIPGLGVPVYSFGLLVALAVFAGLMLAVRRSRKEGLDPNVVYDMAGWLVAGGLVGARLFYVVEYWGEKVTTVGGVLRVWEGGIVLYGALIGAVVGLLAFRAVRRFPVLATLDALAPSAALGVAVGRVGCFLNGCCYGKFCQTPWLAVRFPKGSPPWLAEVAQNAIPEDATASLPLHPTQLYSALDGLVLLALLSAYYPLRRRDGEVAGLLLLAYPVARFVLDVFRDDERPLVLGLTIAQVSSLFLFAFGLLFWSYLSRRPAGRVADRVKPTGAPHDELA
jgi:phosphatidylglycerol:prolipoprotein diacylglycerol transferase